MTEDQATEAWRRLWEFSWAKKLIVFSALGIPRATYRRWKYRRFEDWEDVWGNDQRFLVEKLMAYSGALRLLMTYGIQVG